MEHLALAFFFLHVILLVAFMVFSFANYHERFHQSYDLRNHFPYELNYESRFKDNFIGNLSVLLMSVSMICFYIFFDTKHVNGYYIWVMISGIITAFSTLSIVFIPLKHLKTHLLITTAMIIFSFATPFGIALSNAIHFSSTNSAVSLTLSIVAAVICLFIFILIMNPKLSKWANLEQQKSPDGTVTYVRPKFFVLAFTQWLLIFSAILTEIVTLLTHYLVK